MTRMTLDLTEEVDELLKELAKKKGTTKAEVLRRAIGLYNYLVMQLEGNGKTGTKVSITTQDDTVLKDLVLP